MFHYFYESRVPNKDVFILGNHIGCVVVSVFALSTVYRGFKARSGQAQLI